MARLIGVLPPTFRFATEPDVWVPFVAEAGTDRGDRWADLFGRLRPGVSLEQARADMSAIMAQLGQEYPESHAGWGVEMLAFPEWIIGPQVRQVALMLGASVGLLLLLACANVSNLLVARAISRQREMAIRAALGAGRGAILRQLLTESLALAVLGAAAGLLFAFAAAPLIRTLNPDAIPGVSSAGGSMRSPFRGLNFGNWVADPEAQEEAEQVQVGWDSVTAGYFRTMGIPLIKGRAFEATETSGRVAVISAKLTEQLWPGEDPIGKQLQWIPRIDGPIVTVVGVVGDVRRTTLQDDPRPAYYWSHSHMSWPDMTLMVKTAPAAGAPAGPGTIAGAVREAIWAVDESISVPEMWALSQNLSDAVAAPRFNVQWLGLFAAAALLMATTGIYAIISHSVASRTREIGIRVALGARPANTVRMVLRQGLRLIALGVGLGAVGALSLTRFLDSLLYETEPTDVATFAIVASILAAVAVLASAVPSLRAAKTDPMLSLRSD